jgi:hypothetical protein
MKRPPEGRSSGAAVLASTSGLCSGTRQIPVPRRIVLVQAARLDELAGRDRGRVADDGDQVALTPCLDAQDAEAVLLVVEPDPVDETGRQLGRPARRCLRHQAMMAAVG